MIKVRREILPPGKHEISVPAGSFPTNQLVVHSEYPPQFLVSFLCSDNDFDIFWDVRILAPDETTSVLYMWFCLGSEVVDGKLYHIFMRHK